MEEWFSSGNTLKTGTNTVGSILGDGTEWELRDTAHLYGKNHELKMGIGLQHIKERSDIPTFQNGTFVYLTDTRAIPISYLYGVGSANVKKSTNLYSAFIQDDWRPVSNLTVNLGLRYDLDTDGNNPDFHHPLVPDGRKRDTNNYQPRLGFSWDVAGDGRNLIRGGVGRFTGRFLLVPAFTELQQNGVTGRILYTRVNGAFYWSLCPAFGITDPAVCHAIFPALDPANPTTTGIPLKTAITLLDAKFMNPYADQATLGWTTRLGGSSVFFDTEAIYVKGHDEIFVRDKNWTGNATHVRPNPAYTRSTPTPTTATRSTRRWCQPQRHAQGRPPDHGLADGRRQEEPLRRLQPRVHRRATPTTRPTPRASGGTPVRSSATTSSCPACSDCRGT